MWEASNVASACQTWEKLCVTMAVDSHWSHWLGQSSVIGSIHQLSYSLLTAWLLMTDWLFLEGEIYLDPFFLFTNRQTDRILVPIADTHIKTRQISKPNIKIYAYPMHKVLCPWTKKTDRVNFTCLSLTAKLVSFLLWPHTLAIFFALIFVVLRLLVCLHASIPVVFLYVIWFLPAATTILKYILKNRALLTSQILVHDDITMFLHFPTPYTPTGHVLTILVWDFFLNLVTCFSNFPNAIFRVRGYCKCL